MNTPITFKLALIVLASCFATRALIAIGVGLWRAHRRRWDTLARARRSGL